MSEPAGNGLLGHAGVGWLRAIRMGSSPAGAAEAGGGTRVTDEQGEDALSESGIDTTVPHSARIWNYWLGGKDNYPVDRMAGDQTIAVLPEIVDIARASRQFLERAVRYLAGPAGIRQFLDVGTGLP